MAEDHKNRIAIFMIFRFRRTDVKLKIGNLSRNGKNYPYGGSANQSNRIQFIKRIVEPVSFLFLYPLRRLS